MQSGMQPKTKKPIRLPFRCKLPRFSAAPHWAAMASRLAWLGQAALAACNCLVLVFLSGLVQCIVQSPSPQCLTLCNDLQSSAFFFFAFIDLHLTCRYENLLVWLKLRLFCILTGKDQCEGCCIHSGVDSFLKENAYIIFFLENYCVLQTFILRLFENLENIS